MDLYEVIINGIVHTIQLPAEEAEARGLKKKQHADPKNKQAHNPENKSATPDNKK